MCESRKDSWVEGGKSRWRSMRNVPFLGQRRYGGDNIISAIWVVLTISGRFEKILWELLWDMTYDNQVSDWVSSRQCFCGFVIWFTKFNQSVSQSVRVAIKGSPFDELMHFVRPPNCRNKLWRMLTAVQPPPWMTTSQSHGSYWKCKWIRDSRTF